MRKFVSSIVAISATLTGCASMSGLESESQFACKAPPGVTCSSLSGVYANAIANNLPALRNENRDAQGAAEQDALTSRIVGRAPSAGDPIRTPPRILRIWIAPWEDSDGDFHDQSYIYVVADFGRWVVEHAQQRIIDRYRPTFAQPAPAPQPLQRPVSAAPRQQSGGVAPPQGQMYGPGAAQQSGTEG